jgi:mono/diheme cytochrome c family protein
MPRPPLTRSTTVGAFLLSMILGGTAGNAAPEAAKPATPPPAPAAPAAAAPAPTKIAGFDALWKDMSKEQKAIHMKTTVLPEMKKVFQAFDAKEFKVFNCASCHGKKAKAREFKMPSPELPTLPGTPEAFMEAVKKKPKLEVVAKFMGEQVKPKMAALLGQPEFDMKKPEAGGFGCQNCHVIEKAK